jgi:hypothetical protein
MKNRAWWLGLIVCAAVAVARPRPAAACGGGYGAGWAIVAVGALAIGVADVGLTASDVALGVAGKTPRWYGAAELAFTGPQAALFGTLAAQSVKNGVGGTGPLLVMTAWTGAMAVHGLYLLVRPDDPRPLDPEAPARHARATFRLAPALVSTNRRDAAPGALLFGRF